MNKIIPILSGVSVGLFFCVFLLQMDFSKDQQTQAKSTGKNGSGKKKSVKSGMDVKTDAPASQPEVLPKRRSKKKGGLTRENATGNND